MFLQISAPSGRSGLVAMSPPNVIQSDRTARHRAQHNAVLYAGLSAIRQLDKLLINADGTLIRPAVSSRVRVGGVARCSVRSPAVRRSRGVGNCIFASHATSFHSVSIATPDCFHWDPDTAPPPNVIPLPDYPSLNVQKLAYDISLGLGLGHGHGQGWG